MKVGRWNLALAFAIVLASAHSTYAQSPELKLELDTAFQQYNALYAEGKFAEAKPHARRVVKLGPLVFGADHPNMGIFHSNLGGLYRILGRYGDAEDHYNRALAIGEKAFGPSHPSVGTTLNNLAVLYHDMGRYSDAEQLYRRSLRIREITLGPAHTLTAESRHCIANLYRAMGRDRDAELIRKRSHRLSESPVFQRLANKWRTSAQPLTTCACFDNARNANFITFPQSIGGTWDCPLGWLAACRVDWQDTEKIQLDDDLKSDNRGTGWGKGRRWTFTWKSIEELGSMDRRELFEGQVFQFQGELGPKGEPLPYGPYLDFYQPPPSK